MTQRDFSPSFENSDNVTYIVDGDDTPVVLINFSKIKARCPFKDGEFCHKNLEKPHDCEPGLCPLLKMPLPRCANFLKLMEEG